MQASLCSRFGPQQGSHDTGLDPCDGAPTKEETKAPRRVHKMLSGPNYDASAIQDLMREPIYDISSSEVAIEEALSTPPYPWRECIGEQGKGYCKDVCSQLEGIAGGAPGSPLPPQASAFIEDLRQLYKGIGPDFNKLWKLELSFDIVLDLVERLALTQAAFKASGKVTLIDIGYHYTSHRNVPTIQQRGLLTKAERDALGIFSKHNGSAHGDGIYMGNNPFAFANSQYGTVGLLVARLRGKVEESRRRRSWSHTPDVDTRTSKEGFHQMVILRSSAQCVPLVAFDSGVLDMGDDAAEGNRKVFDMHLRLQSMLDKHFNQGVSTIVLRAVPSDRNTWRKRRRLQPPSPPPKRQAQPPAASAANYNTPLPSAACSPLGLPSAQTQPVSSFSSTAAAASAPSFPHSSTTCTFTVPSPKPFPLSFGAMPASTWQSTPSWSGSNSDSTANSMLNNNTCDGLVGLFLPTPSAGTSQSWKVAQGKSAAAAAAIVPSPTALLYNNLINGGSLDQSIIDILLRINSTT